MAKSDWRDVDVSQELTKDEKTAWDCMKEQYRAYATAKAEFEQLLQTRFAEELAEDEELKFGYNFGKLSIAVGEKRERKPRKAAEAKPSLGDWLKARQGEGRDC